jgi:hypothetical protein
MLLKDKSFGRNFFVILVYGTIGTFLIGDLWRIANTRTRDVKQRISIIDFLFSIPFLFGEWEMAR